MPLIKTFFFWHGCLAIVSWEISFPDRVEPGWRNPKPPQDVLAGRSGKDISQERIAGQQRINYILAYSLKRGPCSSPSGLESKCKIKLTAEFSAKLLIPLEQPKHRTQPNAKRHSPSNPLIAEHHAYHDYQQ